jgi:hypothetical protein
MRLRDMAELPRSGGGWLLLGERPGEETALGLVGKSWRPVIEYAEVSADEFGDFASPATLGPSTSWRHGRSRTGRCSRV